MVVAAQREKNSFHPQAPLGEEETKRTFADGINFQSKPLDLPHPSSGFKVDCCVCVFLASGYGWSAVMHGIPISSLPF
jgi:hypothetical protein